MTNKVTVVAMIVTTESVKLFKSDGEAIEIKQGDLRIPKILEIATVPLSQDKPVDIDLDLIETPNEFRDFEEKSTGFVKFLRIAKKKFNEIVFGEGEETRPAATALNANGVYGRVPSRDALVPSQPVDAPVDKFSDTSGPTAAKVADATAPRKPSAVDAVAEVVRNATPVTAENFRIENTTEDHTIVAVVDNGPGKAKTVVSGMEKLNIQLAHANKLGSHKGAENFIRRIAAVAEKRRFSVQELLDFMQKADMPIADDGSILAYKMLSTHGLASGFDKDTWFDPHTKRVPQKIGSFVCMDEAMVDPDRRRECSQGLHVARRQYVRSFINSANVMALIKIAPEDAIAVPERDPHKMRVCAYHIVGRIPDSEIDALTKNKPMEGSEALRLVTLAIKGDHVPILERVKIGGPSGTKIEITQTGKKGSTDLNKTQEKAVIVDIDPGAPVADVNKIAAEVTATKAAQPPKKPEPVVEAPKPAPASNKAPITRQEKIDHYVGLIKAKGPEAIRAATELVAIQKAAKKSFKSLGISDTVIVQINNLTVPVEKPTAKKTVAAVKAITKTADKAVKAKAKVEKAADTPPTPKKAPAKKPVPSKPKPDKAPKKDSAKLPAKIILTTPEIQTRVERADTRTNKVRVLLDVLETDTYAPESQKIAYRELIAFKKKAKAGWGQLGVMDFDAIQAKFES